MAFLLILSGLEQYLIFKVGLITGKFYEVLGNKDSDHFSAHITYSLLLIGWDGENLKILYFYSKDNLETKILETIVLSRFIVKKLKHLKKSFHIKL
jgi:hypothetical protein